MLVSNIMTKPLGTAIATGSAPGESVISQSNNKYILPVVVAVAVALAIIILISIHLLGTNDDNNGENANCSKFTIPSGPNMANNVPVPTKPYNGKYTIPTGYCKDGYHASLNEITCEASGKWSTPVPTCIQGLRTTTTTSGDVVAVGGVVTVVDAGVAATLADAPTPTCTLPTSHSCPSTCGPLRVYEHDSLEPCIPTTYTCLPGDGDCEKCSLDSYYTFTGLRVSQSVAGYIKNSDLKDRWNNKPTIISSDICSAGYSLSRDITCPAQGTWSTPTPTCIQDPTQCNSLINITSDMTDIRTTINVPTDYCNGGMTPSPSTIKCGDNGIWSTKPTCVNKTDGRGDNDEAETTTCSLDQFYKIQVKINKIDEKKTTKKYILEKLNWKGWTDLHSGGGSADQKLVFKDTDICKQGFTFSKDYTNNPTCSEGVWNDGRGDNFACVSAQTPCEYKYDITNDINNDIYPIIIQNKDRSGFDETLDNSSLTDCENYCCDKGCFAWYFNKKNNTCSIINNLDGKYLDTGAPHTELSGGKSKTHVCPAIVIPSVANVPLSTPNTEIQMISLCPVDMKLSSPTITCSEDGTWSTLTPTPTCIPNA